MTYRRLVESDARTLLNQFTEILQSAEAGEPRAAESLLEEVYSELRKLAAVRMAREAPGQTLQPTALVHEAWIRLIGGKEQQFKNRKHFFAAAAEAMRRILIDNARRKGRLRHGANQQKVQIDHVTLAIEDTDETVLGIHEALEQLAQQDPFKAEIVKMRYFIGMKHQEIAEALDSSEATIRRHWAYARSWLYAALKEPQKTRTESE